MQANLPIGDLDAFGLLLVFECAVEQPVDQRSFADRAAAYEDEFGFIQRAFVAEIIIKDFIRFCRAGSYCKVPTANSW